MPERKKIGRGEMYLGDCMAVMPTLDAQSIDFLVTDMPYECSATTITRNDQKDWDSHFGEWDKFFTEWVAEAYRVLAPNSGMVVFVPATRFETLMNECERVGFTYVQPWFWSKPNPPVSIRGCLQWAVEHMIYVRKGKHELRIKNCGKCPNIFEFPSADGERVHRTQKPVPLMQKIIEYVSDTDQIIFDPFSGSGSTGVAAVSLDRRFVGIEQNKEFFTIACDRINTESDPFEWT